MRGSKGRIDVLVSNIHRLSSGRTLVTLLNERLHHQWKMGIRMDTYSHQTTVEEDYIHVLQYLNAALKRIVFWFMGL